MLLIGLTQLPALQATFEFPYFFILKKACFKINIVSVFIIVLEGMEELLIKHSEKKLYDNVFSFPCVFLIN